MQVRKATRGAQLLFLFVTITMNLAVTSSLAGVFVSYQLNSMVKPGSMAEAIASSNYTMMAVIIGTMMSVMGAIVLFAARRSLALDFKMLNERLNPSVRYSAKLAVDPVIAAMIFIGNIFNAIGIFIIVHSAFALYHLLYIVP